LAAIYLGCQHLKQNDADYALVTGVELLLDNRPFELLRAGGALSATQSCKPFSAEADGIVLGEGGGTILLKRLKDALRDGDKIEALIHGGAMNNDGQTMGITTPNPQSQTAVVKKALANAGIQPELISYIEAHATGTAIGDPMELAALNQVFATNKKTSCAVGSVKANIGHLLSAAGMASILKVVLSLKHQQIPKSIGCDSPNPRFQFADSPFYLLKDNLNWTSEQPRFAGVSGFGFGGTNLHLILSEFSTLEYQPQRVAMELPKYNKKYIWPDLDLKLSDEMDSFFDIKALFE
jgi:acyl transferase domain-containing protein